MGNGFPEIKLVEPLAAALRITVTELVQGQRVKETPAAQTDAAVIRAMECGAKMTARKYLRLFWLLLLGTSCCLIWSVWPYVSSVVRRVLHEMVYSDRGMHVSLGTATMLSPWLAAGIPAAVAVACLLLAVGVRRAERDLKQ